MAVLLMICGVAFFAGMCLDRLCPSWLCVVFGHDIDCWTEDEGMICQCLKCGAYAEVEG